MKMCRLPNVCNRPRCWQLRRIELWLRPDQRWRQRNKIAVVSSLLPTSLPVEREKNKPRENRKIHRVSSVAEVIISGDSVLNDSRKDLAKEVWSFDSELFETVVLQADVVLDCGATETSGGVEAVQILVDAVTQSFPDSRVVVDTLDRRLSQESGC